jgi:hypothetical protein
VRSHRQSWNESKPAAKGDSSKAEWTDSNRAECSKFYSWSKQRGISLKLAGNPVSTVMLQLL